MWNWYDIPVRGHRKGYRISRVFVCALNPIHAGARLIDALRGDASAQDIKILNRPPKEVLPPAGFAQEDIIFEEQATVH